jgi:uncharacterized coiled-coil DUF342 family protein
MTLLESTRLVRVPNQTIHGATSPSEKPLATASEAKVLAPRIRKFEYQADAMKQRAALMERMIIDFESMAAALDREVRIEQERVRIYDPAHFAYPTYAKAAASRRDNLKHSADELRMQLATAKQSLLGLGVAEASQTK